MMSGRGDRGRRDSDPPRVRGGDTSRVNGPGRGVEVFGASPGVVPAATIAARRVAEVRNRPHGRLDLLRSSYAPLPGTHPQHLRYRRAALAFMDWQVRRGLLNPLDHQRPGSPWWRAVNERLLRDTCEARLRVLGHPGPASLPSVEPSIRFVRQPSSRTWYLAHNVTIVSAYLDHRVLAERESRVERFFINLVLLRLLYAHALVAAPRLALGWLAPIAPWLGDPRRAMTGMFLSVSQCCRTSIRWRVRSTTTSSTSTLSVGSSTWASSRRASPSCTAGQPTSYASRRSLTSSVTPRRRMRGIPATESPGRRGRQGSSAPCAGHSRQCLDRFEERGIPVNLCSRVDGHAVDLDLPPELRTDAVAKAGS